MFLFLGSLREVNLELAKKLETINVEVIPGQKLCPTCHVKVYSHLEEKENDIDIVESDKEVSGDDFEVERCNQDQKELLNKTINSMSISPVKLHGVTSFPAETIPT